MGRDVQIKEERVKEGETIEKAKCSIKSEEYKMCIKGDKKKKQIGILLLLWNKISCRIITKIVHTNSKI